MGKRHVMTDCIRFLLILTFCSNTFYLKAQTEDKNMLAFKYFKVYPSASSHEELTLQIEKATNAKRDTLIHHTDSTAFYYRGFTTFFNPFQMPVKEIEIQIREGQGEKDMKFGSKTLLLIIEVIAITDSTENSKLQVSAEYRKLKNELSASFTAHPGLKSKRKSSRPFEHITFSSTQTNFKNIFLSWGGHYKYVNTHCLSLSFLFEMFTDNKN